MSGALTRQLGSTVEWRRPDGTFGPCVVSAWCSEGLLQLTPIPEGLTAMDMGRRFLSTDGAFVVDLLEYIADMEPTA